MTITQKPGVKRPRINYKAGDIEVVTTEESLAEDLCARSGTLRPTLYYDSHNYVYARIFIRGKVAKHHRGDGWRWGRSASQARKEGVFQHYLLVEVQLLQNKTAATLFNLRRVQSSPEGPARCAPPVVCRSDARHGRGNREVCYTALLQLCVLTPRASTLVRLTKQDAVAGRAVEIVAGNNTGGVGYLDELVSDRKHRKGQLSVQLVTERGFDDRVHPKLASLVPYAEPERL